MEIKESTLLQRVEAYYRLFDSNGETLAIIEPGYIVNKYAYVVWRLLDEEKTLNELLKELCLYIEGADEKDLTGKIIQVIELFYIRSLVKVDGDIRDQSQYTYQKTQN